MNTNTSETAQMETVGRRCKGHPTAQTPRDSGITLTACGFGSTVTIRRLAWMLMFTGFSD
jgi:hypothetical protein